MSPAGGGTWWSRRGPARTIALIAHDEKKAELARFLRAYAGVLDRVRFLAPADTARALEGIPIDVEHLAPDSMGGDLQVGAAIVEGRVDALIFLGSPLGEMQGEPDLRPLLKVCDLEGVPLSTNLGSAELLIRHLATMGEGRGRSRDRHEPRVSNPRLTLVRPDPVGPGDAARG